MRCQNRTHIDSIHISSNLSMQKFIWNVRNNLMYSDRLRHNCNCKVRQRLKIGLRLGIRLVLVFPESNPITTDKQLKSPKVAQRWPKINLHIQSKHHPCSRTSYLAKTRNIPHELQQADRSLNYNLSWSFHANLLPPLFRRQVKVDNIVGNFWPTTQMTDTVNSKHNRTTRIYRK